MIGSGPQDAGSDLWVLLAVGYASADGRGADRAMIGLVAGLIHPGCLSGGRLEETLGRLRDAGLVREREGLFIASDAVATFLRARTHRRGVWHDYHDLAGWLGVASGR
jgi:hypothetical protein